MEGHPDLAELAAAARLAIGDAWQSIGELFARGGGATGAVRGMRLVASGLPHPQYNPAEVTSTDADVAAAAAFYAERGLPWAMRVPAETPWRHGAHVLRKRTMCLLPALAQREPVPMPAGVRLALAGPHDLEVLLAIDAAAYGSDPGQTRPWLAALIDGPDEVSSVLLAARGSEVVGTGYSVRAAAGILIGGVAVAPGHRQLGIGTALTDRLARAGFSSGAPYAVLEPDDERAARLYARLGFVETAGTDIYAAG